MKKRFIPAVLTAVALAFGGAATAQTDNYPNRTIRLIAPYSPGSGPDSVARALSDELSKKWGQQVVVENRPGANGTLGVTALKQAKPDGYTLILLDNSMTAINPHLYSDLPYNVEKDLTPLAFLMTTSFYLMVTSNGPIQSVQQLMDVAKKNPGKLSYGSPTGVGHVTHLGMLSFLKQTGLNMVFVPYKGTSAMLTDVTTGTLEMGWASYASARGMVEKGGVKPIAVGASERQPTAPDVPTMKEAGAPEEFEALAWVAMYGPAGLPDGLAKKISADVRAVLAMPQIAERIVTLGNGTLDGDGAAVKKRLDSESERNKAIINEMGLKL